MMKLILLVVGLLFVVVMLVAVSGNHQTAANFGTAIKDGSQGVLDGTAGRAEKGIRRIGYEVKENVEDAADGLVEAARTADQTVLDTSITAAVKMKFAKDELVSASRIHVDTKNGIVTLSGTVFSRDEADRTLELARRVEGVRKVVSKLWLLRENTTEENRSAQSL